MHDSITKLLITDEFETALSKNIQESYNALIQTVAQVPEADWTLKNIHFGTEIISPQNLIAYQVGWGKLLLSWYTAGIQGMQPIMPGEGFTAWNYKRIAHHFYTTYMNYKPQELCQDFQRTVLSIIEISEKESLSGNLDKIDVWAWCTLASGRAWPLAKWVQINTVAPYKRARTVLKRYY